MNKTVAQCSFISATALWLALSFSAPWVFGDSNSFLKGFVNHELLNFLGVIVTITLASTANLHIELNKLEEMVKKPVFIKTRGAVKRSAYSLIIMLLMALIIAVAKPLVVTVPEEQLIASSLFNGFAVLIVFFNILVLTDLIQTAFKLEPNYES